MELFCSSEFDDRESESNQDQRDADVFRRRAFLFQDDDAERHADGQAKLSKYLNIRDIRHEIHREEHENVSDGDDDARDGRAPLALRDDFAGVGAEGRCEGDDRPEDCRQDDAADGVDRHGADVRLDLRDELRDDFLSLAVFFSPGLFLIFSVSFFMSILRSAVLYNISIIKKGCKNNPFC